MDSGIHPKTVVACTLESIVDQVRWSDAIFKKDLNWGDQVIVTTRNSIYSLWALGADSFAVSGGWFDRQEMSPAKVAVNGCTFGGTAISCELVAAPGLFLEFGNNVLTTRIQDVRVVRCKEQPQFN